MRSRVLPELLLPAACIAGAALLVASQFMTIFELNAAGETTLDLIEPVDQHWYAMVVLGAFAILAVAGAALTGSKPLAASVAVAGAVALLLFLLIDLPDAGKAGNVSDPDATFVTAEAEPAGGFWIELIGALVLTVCGGALATLTPEQLRAPARRPRRGGRDRGGRGGTRRAPWERDRGERAAQGGEKGSGRGRRPAAKPAGEPAAGRPGARKGGAKPGATEKKAGAKPRAPKPRRSGA